MSIMHAEWRDRLKHWQRTLKDDLYVPLGAFTWEAFRTMEHLSPQQAQEGNFEPVQTGFTLGKDLGILLDALLHHPSERSGRQTDRDEAGAGRGIHDFRQRAGSSALTALPG